MQYSDYINGRNPLGSMLGGGSNNQLPPWFNGFTDSPVIRMQDGKIIRQGRRPNAGIGGVYGEAGSEQATPLWQTPQPVKPPNYQPPLMQRPMIGALASGAVPATGLPQHGGTALPAGTVIPGQGTGYWQSGAGGRRTWTPILKVPAMQFRGMGQRRSIPPMRVPQPIDGGYGGPVYPREPVALPTPRRRPVIIPL